MGLGRAAWVGAPAPSGASIVMNQPDWAPRGRYYTPRCWPPTADRPRSSVPGPTAYPRRHGTPSSPRRRRHVIAVAIWVALPPSLRIRSATHDQPFAGITVAPRDPPRRRDRHGRDPDVQGATWTTATARSATAGHCRSGAVLRPPSADLRLSVGGKTATLERRRRPSASRPGLAGSTMRLGARSSVRWRRRSRRRRRSIQPRTRSGSAGARSSRQATVSLGPAGCGDERVAADGYPAT